MRGVINEAVAHQNRIKFHAMTSITESSGQPLTSFLSWVGSLIPKDKFAIFKSLFRYPVKTNELTAICFDKLSRVFDGRNPSFDYQFESNEDKDDWEWYRTEILKEPTIWQTKGWEFMQTEINSVLVIDMPTEPDKNDRRAQPYFYWLPIADVIDFLVNEKTGNMEYIIFRQPDKIAVIDDEYYRVFANENENVGTLLIEQRHGIGYCPARFFWSDTMSIEKPFIKKSPITTQLEALDWFLFFHISKRHLDLYGAYPIYSGYEQNCNYSNPETNEYCDGGFLRNAKGVYRMDASGLLCKCPKCGDKRIAGVGSFVEVPIPAEGQPDLRNPVQMLTADVNSLDYNVKEENRLKEDIITAIVGTDNEIISNEALNERQVQANFESQSTILNRIKKNFEQAQRFVDSTICRLRYGSSFISANINLGTEFYAVDIAQLRERYKTAKDAGASESELDALQQEIIESEYRTNPTMRQRMLTLAELEPLRHLTRQEALELFKEGLIDEQTMHIKLRFSELIQRFERENTNVLEFGTDIPFVSKINKIKQALETYESEIGRRQD